MTTIRIPAPCDFINSNKRYHHMAWQQGITRYWLANPDRPNDESHYSWTESDWADVEPAAEELGRLF